MTDFAKLVMSVDASGMAPGEQALDSLAAKATQAESKVTGALDAVGKKAKQRLDEAASAASRAVSGFGDTAQAAQRAGQTANTASGYMGTLTSQWNDIAVMIAAGQNPMQLMMQQGTQVTQVMQQMGGGVGALRAIGASFMAMVSPMNLATLAVIGLGAAGAQAMLSMGGSTKTLTDALDDLNDSLSEAKEAIALMDAAKLHEEFGGATEQIRAMVSALGQISMRKLNDDAKELVKSFRALYDGNAWLNQSRTEDMVALGLGRDETRQLSGAVDAMGRADTLEKQLQIAEAIRAKFTEWAGPVGQMTSAQAQYYAHLVDTEAALRRIVDTQRDAASAEESASNARLREMQAYGGSIREMWEARARFAADEKADLEQQAELTRLIAIHGEDSAIVANARAQAEREAYAEMLASKGITGELAADLLEAWDNAKGLAGVDMATSINNAGFAASFLATEMGNALYSAQLLGALAPDLGRFTDNPSLPGMTKGSETWFWGMTRDSLLPPVRGIRQPPARPGSKGGGRGNREAERYERSVIEIQRQTEAFLAQADALSKVATAGGDWERALAVIEEEQKLLNAAQRAGIQITPELKAQINEMAQAYVDAETALERIRTSTERGQDAFRDLFGSILEGAGSAKQALANLLMQMAKVQFAKGMLGLLGGTSWGSTLIKSVGESLTFDGGGYTGDGSRSGGLDGKGGFMAMLHPQETVIDHTKGQSAGGGVVKVIAEHDPGILMRVIDSRVDAAKPGFVSQAVSAARYDASENPWP